MTTIGPAAASPSAFQITSPPQPKKVGQDSDGDEGKAAGPNKIADASAASGHKLDVQV